MADNPFNTFIRRNRLVLGLAALIYVLDQFAKWLVLQTLPGFGDEKSVIP